MPFSRPSNSQGQAFHLDWSVFCWALLALATPLHAQTETILYAFNSTPYTLPSSPNGGLIMDSLGNFYGTTGVGGSQAGLGTLYKLAPDGTLTVLHNFGAPGDGSSPNGELAMDSQGNLYGTTYVGGTRLGSRSGTAFEIAADGTYTDLYNFSATENAGYRPNEGVILDSHGNLYGTTTRGGYGRYCDLGACGTVFEIQADGTLDVLHTFDTLGVDGDIPAQGRLAMDAQGSFYGATAQGGTFNSGTIFKLAADQTETVLHSFGTQTNEGSQPNSGLVLDASGNLYGSTSSGGVGGGGTLFKITPAGKETVLYSFTQGQTPWAPLAGLVMDPGGNLYGTTSGAVGSASSGAVFMLAPSGALTVLHNFPAAPSTTDGTGPADGLLLDTSGNLYGAASGGGPNGGGILYKIALAGAAVPTFAPLPGTYASAQSVTIADNTVGATIYYTTDGQVPTNQSAVYTGPIQVTASGTLTAVAIAPGLSSATAVGPYRITGGACVVIDESNGFSSTGLTLNGSAAIVGGLLQLTSGAPNQKSSVFSSSRVPIESSSTDFTFQLNDAWTEGFTITSQGNNPQALGVGGAGLGYEGISNSAALGVDLFNIPGVGHDSTGLYMNGAPLPTVPPLELSWVGIYLNSGHVFAAHLDYINGVSTSSITDTVTGVSSSVVLQGYFTAPGETAFVGFTAATGAQTSGAQNILTWKYQGGTACTP